MPRLSKLIEKAEDKAQSKFGSWYDRHKTKFRLYVPVGIVAWYFYGMFLNSMRLGIASTFSTDGEKPASIWVANPFRNFLAVFTTFGLAATAVIALLICLITNKVTSGFQGTNIPMTSAASIFSQRVRTAPPVS